MNKEAQLKGYVHNVSAVSTAKRGSLRYFRFHFQVEEGDKRRAVCYDLSKRKVLKSYEEAREPVKLSNVSGKRCGGRMAEENIVLTRRSRIEPANNFDIHFEYEEENGLGDDQQGFTAIEAIASLCENQVISVKGCVTFEGECVKQVTMKDNSIVPMLNRCTITDNTGIMRLTLLGDAIQQMVNNKCYIIEHVLIKKYDGMKYVATNHKTVISATEEKFNAPTEEAFETLFDVEKLMVDKIHLAQSFKKWLSCCKCRKKLIDTSCSGISIVKCGNCKTVQPLSVCCVNASVRIAVRNKSELIWLKAFTPVLEEMLRHPAPDVTVNSPEEEIYQQLFDLQNVSVEYGKSSFTITNIYFESL